jgi:hypothetical protein
MIRVFIFGAYRLHDAGTCRIAKFFVSGTHDGIELKATLSHFAQFRNYAPIPARPDSQGIHTLDRLGLIASTTQPLYSLE